MKGVINDELKVDDIEIVIKARACVRTRGEKTLYFISRLY